jgi:hypothetical protein
VCVIYDSDLAKTMQTYVLINCCSGRMMRIFTFYGSSLRTLVFYDACGTAKHVFHGLFSRFSVCEFKGTARDALIP